MRRAARLAQRVLAIGALAPVAAASEPLDVSDPTPRAVLVQVEGSTALGVVGQSFGPSFPATWSAAGGVGTLTISAATHEEMRPNFLTPVPGSFTPIVIEIDLATLQAASQPAGGAYQDGPVSFSFSQQALSTTGTAGFIGPTQPPLFCVSQAQVDALCQIVPSFCGQTCTLVPGSPYDPATGRINLVGRETQQGCDGFPCFPAIDFFTQRGDLRLSEALEIPALSAPGGAALAALLAAGAGAALAGRRPRD